VKPGEKMVWAAAFAQAIGAIDWEHASDEKQEESIGMAVGRAYCTVIALRKLAAVPATKSTLPALAMLREMTDPPEHCN
jgi:hypothetical protein